MEMTRRHMFAAASAAAAMTFPHTALGGWEPASATPIPRSRSSIPASTGIACSTRRRAAGNRHALVRRAGLFRRRPLSDLERHPQQPASCAGTRPPARSASIASLPTTPTAMRRDRQGRLLTCEHDGAAGDAHRIRRHHHRAVPRSRASRSTRRTTSCCKSDGSIWFTDPPFGILSNYEGNARQPELPTNVYRIDPKTGKATSWRAI